MFDTNSMFNGMFGKVKSGMCRLSMNGKIAIKTSTGYKTYNTKTGRLTNCSNFAFDIGEDFFFVIPTNKVTVGDIILVGGKPRAVIGVEENAIRAFSYEDSTIETIVPEHHVFMGNTYFYGKIVSMFGNSFGKKGGMNNIFKYMMLSEMFKGNKESNSYSYKNDNNSNMGNMLPFMMMMGGNGFTDMFDGMFDEDANINLNFDADEEIDEEEDA